MQKVLEYRTSRVRVAILEPDDTLREMGADGWELVSTQYVGTEYSNRMCHLFFKREKA